MELRALGRLLGAHPLVAAGVALLVRSELGAAPWDVFHLGIAHTAGISPGAAATATAIAAVLAALASGIPPGIGTLINAAFLGACIDAALAALPTARGLVLALTYLAAGVALTGLGTGLYLSAAAGAGPRDSLMLAVARRLGCSASRARLTIELAVLAAGLALGGRPGPGTLAYAAAIGPAAQWGIDLFAKDSA